jgi:hypothetical protein
MPAPTHGEPDAAVRAHAGPQERVRIHARNLSFDTQGRASWADTAEHPSALDCLLAALATDLLAGLWRESQRGGPAVHDAELRLQAWLESPLVVAGVVGETGSPRVRQIRGSLYLACDASDDDVGALWRRVLERAPVHTSLAFGVAVTIELKRVS